MPLIVRKQLRLPQYDYATNNAYFITICTAHRRRVFTGAVREIATQEFEALVDRYFGLSIDCWTLQPDHLHSILLLSNCHTSLTGIVQAYKSITTRLIRQIVEIDRVWQRGFYDRVVRNDLELQALREYVNDNDLIHAVRASLVLAAK